MLAFSFKYQRQSFGENVGEIEEESQVDEIESKTISEKDDQPYLNVADKSSDAVNTYRKIDYFIRNFPVNSVLLFFRFFAGHLCCDTTHIDDSSTLESREVKQVNKFDQNDDVFIDEKVEKGMLAFSFKYQRPSFGENIEEIEEELQVDEIESKIISEKEDQPYLNFADIPGLFLSEKILSGFTKEHVAKDGSSLDEMLYVSCGIKRSEVNQEAPTSEKTIYYLVNEFYGYYYSGDSLKDVAKKKENDNVITSEMPRDIMEETIEVFWKFGKAEKYETPILIRLLTENNVKIQDPSDYKLMKMIQL